MVSDLISRKQAQEAILNCDAIMFNPDREIAIKAIESVPAVIPKYEKEGEDDA